MVLGIIAFSLLPAGIEVLKARRRATSCGGRVSSRRGASAPL
jgi:hypothetical protein